MKLFNIDNTKDDKHKSGKNWIVVLQEYKKIFCNKNISIDKHLGAHMSDHPNDNFLNGNFLNHKWYIVSVPNDDTNKKPSDEPIIVDGFDYEEYEILRKFNA